MRSADVEHAWLTAPPPAPAWRPAALIPAWPPDPTARTLFILYQTADAAYWETPYQTLGEGVLATVWWPDRVSPAVRADVEAAFLCRYGRDEGLHYYWYEYPE